VGIDQVAVLRLTEVLDRREAVLEVLGGVWPRYFDASAEVASRSARARSATIFSLIRVGRLASGLGAGRRRERRDGDPGGGRHQRHRLHVLLPLRAP
jgi:hypothetical protein